MKRISMGLRAPDPAVVKALEASAEAQEQIARMVASLMADMRSHVAPAPTKQITRWQFEIVRDEDGQMQSIIATAHK